MRFINNFIFGIECSDQELFKLRAREILKQMKNGRGDWEKGLPDGIADQIIQNRYFGYRK